MACCLTAPSHYLSQCWSRSLLPYGVTRRQWVLNRCLTYYTWRSMCWYAIWTICSLTWKTNDMGEVYIKTWYILHADKYGYDITSLNAGEYLTILFMSTPLVSLVPNQKKYSKKENNVHFSKTCCITTVCGGLTCLVPSHYLNHMWFLSIWPIQTNFSEKTNKSDHK